MKKYIGFISGVVMIVILVGCATVSKEDCLLTDWFEIGRMDGIQGKPRSAFQNRARQCLEHGVPVDRQAYYQGHDEGLIYYCTEQNGFELGRQGSPYSFICPPQFEGNFQAGYQKGIQLFCTEQNGYNLGYRGRTYSYICPPEYELDFRRGYLMGKEVFEYNRKTAFLHRRLEKIDKKIMKKEAELNSKHLSDKQRNEIRTELRSLDLEYRDISREIKYIEKMKPTAQNY